MFDFLWQPGGQAIELVEPWFDWLKDDESAPSLAVWMLYAAFALLLFHGFWLHRACTCVKRWRGAIEAQTPEAMAEALPGIEERAMVARGAQFRFWRNTIERRLRHTWSEFQETLITPEPDARQIVWNTTRPQNFFNARSVGLEFRFFAALPGIFVGVGLLLTFFGLVSALYFATSGMNEAGSVEDTQEALKGLLSAASFKFYTSIAGLLASLVFVVWLRIAGRIVDASLAAFCKSLEERLQFATEESKIFQLTAIAERQREELHRLNTDIAMAIGQQVENALNNALPVHLATPLQGLSERLEHVAGNLNNMNVEALQSMGEAFNRELRSATQGQFQELATTLGNLQAGLEGMQERMNASSTQFAEAAATIAQRAGDAGNQAIQATGQSAGALRDILEGAAQEFSRIGAEIAEHREAVGQLTEGAGAAGDAAQTAARAFREASEPLTVVARNIQEAADSMRSTMESAEEAIRGAQDHIRQAGGHLSEAARTALQASERFGGVDESLANVMNGMISRTQEALGHIQTYVTQLDGLHSQSIDRLASGIENLQEIAESLEEAAQHSAMPDGE